MVTFTAAAARCTYGLIRANEDGWTDAGSVGHVRRLGRAARACSSPSSCAPTHPMLDLALLRNRSFVGVLLAGLLLTFAAFSAFTYTSIWLQSVLGLSPDPGRPDRAAAVARGVRGVRRRSAGSCTASRPGPIIGGGLLFIGVGGLVGAALVHGSASWPALIPGFVVIGIGVGLATPTLGSAAMSAVPPQRGGMAAGAVNTARQLGFAFGIAVLGSVFATRAAAGARPTTACPSRPMWRRRWPAARRRCCSPAPAAPALDDAFHAAAVSGLQWAFLVSGVVGVLAGLAVLALVRPASRPPPTPRRSPLHPTRSPPRPVGPLIPSGAGGPATSPATHFFGATTLTRRSPSAGQARGSAAPSRSTNCARSVVLIASSSVVPRDRWARSTAFVTMRRTERLPERGIAARAGLRGRRASSR